VSRSSFCKANAFKSRLLNVQFFKLPRYSIPRPVTPQADHAARALNVEKFRFSEAAETLCSHIGLGTEWPDEFVKKSPKM
jgi:hypothetical protein